MPIDPRVEAMLVELIGKNADTAGTEWRDSAAKLGRLPFISRVAAETFDSEHERRFFGDILPKLGNSNLLRYWRRQVGIGALTGRKSDILANQRVDFLFACPGAQRCLVVEVDGRQHMQQQTADTQRDDLLRSVGIDVLRIRTAEIDAGTGPAIQSLQQYLATYDQPDVTEASTGMIWLLACRRVQQLHMVLMEGFERGLLPTSGQLAILINVDQRGFLGEKSDRKFSEAVIEDFNRLVQDVCAAIGVTAPPDVRLSDETARFRVVFDDGFGDANSSTVVIGDGYFPATPSIEVPSTAPYNARSVDRAACERLLQRLYGYAHFREGQFEAIDRVLRGMDSLVLLPTGSGKSIAFQFAAFLRPGVGIIVDPILSLIDDQIENLRAAGIDRVTKIIGTQTVEEREELLEQLGRGQCLFCYVAPERFQNSAFRGSLRALTTHTPVALVAIDEAHCVSEWGHDFRPAYLNLSRIAREYCATGQTHPPLMGLTGTASRSVLKDIQRELDITDYDAIIVPKSFDRPELSYQVLKCSSGEKPARLNALLDQLPVQFGEAADVFYSPRDSDTKSGIIFCPHANGDHGVVAVGQAAAARIGKPVTLYASTPPRNHDEATWPSRLRDNARDFKRNKMVLMSATKAYGMGIDKPNVRYTVHYNLPASIEAFYQEAGRAGRDGKPAKCFILFSDDFPARSARLLDPSSPISFIQQEVARAGWDHADDVTRALFFHNNTFRGIEIDDEMLERVVGEMGELSQARHITIRSDDGEARKAREKVIHRLLLTGVVADYTIDFSNKQFQIDISGISKDAMIGSLFKYIAAYQRMRGMAAAAEARRHIGLPYREFVIAVARQLTRFVYEVIERGRRQALSEMLRTCGRALNSESIRSDILKYLERSKFATQIELILDSEDAGIKAVPGLVEEVRSHVEAAELRGECSRELESYPDQPALRLLLAAAEAMMNSPDKTEIGSNIEAAFRDGIEKYGLSWQALLDASASMADAICGARPDLARLILQRAIQSVPDRRGASRRALMMIANRRHPLVETSVAILAKDVAERVHTLIGG